MVLLKSIFQSVLFSIAFYLAFGFLLAASGLQVFTSWFYTEMGFLICAVFVTLEILILKL